MSYVTTLLLQTAGEPEQVAWVNAQAQSGDIVHALQPIDPNPEFSTKAAELYLFACVLNYDLEIADRLIAAVLSAQWVWPEDVVLTVNTPNDGTKVYRPGAL